MHFVHCLPNVLYITDIYTVRDCNCCVSLETLQAKAPRCFPCQYLHTFIALKLAFVLR